MVGLEKRLKDRELLLLVASAASGTLEGRTVAQKLVYFAGRKLGQSTGHTPYFYGPYSDDFDAALKRGVLAEEFSEQIERIPDWFGGQDALKHIYELTERGKEAASTVAEEHKQEAQEVRSTIVAIAEAVPGFRQRTLSAAAKIDLIITEQERFVPLTEVRLLAQELGWQLSDHEAQEALEVLRRLDLVHASAAEAGR
jgi:uncharacterized protein YwgA